jgi:hypothetical protein
MKPLLCAAALMTFACQPMGGQPPAKSLKKPKAPSSSRKLDDTAKAALPPKVRDAADGTAARKLFDDAVRAQLAGDALAHNALLSRLAVHFPNTRHGRAAGRRLQSSGFGVAGVGIMAAVAIPAFMKYTKRAKSSEGRMNLRIMSDGARAYYDTEHANKMGEILPRQFPDSAGPTPAAVPCGKIKGPMPNPPNMWGAPGWQALNFQPSGSVRYQYQFISDSKSFTARAHGDLDCDGELSTFELIGRINAEGRVDTNSGMFIENELE